MSVKVKVRERNDPNRSIHVALPPGLKPRIADAAKREGLSSSAWIVRMAMAALTSRRAPVPDGSDFPLPSFFTEGAFPRMCGACRAVLKDAGHVERHASLCKGGAR